VNDTLDRIDEIFRSVDREIWIVTAADGDRRGGLIATWVLQASIDRERPVVMAGIAPNHFTAELIDGGGAFALHLVGADHVNQAWNFVLGSGRELDKFAEVEWFTAETNSPILCDCLSWLDCRVFAALRTGDRNYYWADVLAGERLQPDTPLTEQDLLALATEEQKRTLREDREADIASQRPAQDVWRARLPEVLKAD
jgi:flavin reductase (DIM6/NTAB) family NADH-FMN oxidoreductase RutF